jgi:GT2 family glycosyltransferase
MQSFNYLAEAARGKYILKVDDDIEVPCSFGKRLVCAFEQVKEPNLAYLGWDMQWTPGKTFANRSGMHLYKEESGKVVHLSDETSVYISYNPRKWMVNGVCRLSLRDTFLKLGGHPKGILYGVDAHVSRQARKAGYWVGFLHTADLVVHCGHDTKAYRDFKDEQMILAGALKHV